MRVLLDTNVVLRLTLEPERISAAVRDMLESDSTTLVMSAIASWEIAIKWHNGRLPLPQPPNAWVPWVVREFGAEVLPVTLGHTLAVADLPDHHRDPFDRLLIAQAQVERMPIVTADRSFTPYDVEIIPAR